MIVAGSQTGATPFPRTRFDEIEGLRGWLALIVVAGHTANYVGANIGRGKLLWSILSPAASVSVFICISGFVIAHLLLKRPEPFAEYIVRRFFRIFPCFAVACAAGAITAGLTVAALPAMGWAGTPGFELPGEAIATWQSQIAWPWLHTLLHLTMLHGVVPDTLLPFSERVFLAPGWSLTLEWQFYLVAPLVMPLFAHSRRLTLGLALTGAVTLLWFVVLRDHYRLPAFLPGKFYAFTIGILSRVYLGQVRKVEAVRAVRWGVLAGCMLLAVKLPWLAIWCAFILLLAAPPQGPAQRAASLLLAGGPAMLLGRLSYVLYAMHYPCLELSGYLVLRHSGLNGASVPAAIGATTAILCLAASFLVHHLVEKPGIRAGARLAERFRETRARRPPPVGAHEADLW